MEYTVLLHEMTRVGMRKCSTLISEQMADATAALLSGGDSASKSDTQPPCPAQTSPFNFNQQRRVAGHEPSVPDLLTADAVSHHAHVFFAALYRGVLFW